MFHQTKAIKPIYRLGRGYLPSSGYTPESQRKD